jgi:hypothetical protein
MADITMCSGECCMVKNKCYRHTAPWNEYRQSMFTDVPGKDRDCSQFWENDWKNSDVKSYLVRKDLDIGCLIGDG